MNKRQLRSCLKYHRCHHLNQLRLECHRRQNQLDNHSFELFLLLADTYHQYLKHHHRQSLNLYNLGFHLSLYLLHLLDCLVYRRYLNLNLYNQVFRHHRYQEVCFQSLFRLCLESRRYLNLNLYNLEFHRHRYPPA